MIPLVDKIYGKWTVKEFSHKKRGDSYWLCLCSCGKEKTIRGSALKQGKTKSCGCLQRELIIQRNLKHGKYYTQCYSSYRAMLARCYNFSHVGYQYYGARGITVCNRWLESFENFYKDMGDPPEGTSLDRINSNKNYEPTNCRWASNREQGNNRNSNRLILYNKETKTIREWSEELGINYYTLVSRLNNLPVEEAFLRPLRKYSKSLKG